ncbi:MAG: protein kinase [Lachnospiraceae bacterium]|nr:protein kinase [Lachnospiraceae bacterium]
MQNIINSIMFGKYKILSHLGTGTFSTVYLAKHLILECYRAIKIIPKSPSQPNTLLNEVHILKSMHHTQIPIIYEIEEDSDNYYVIEEFIDGESLDNFLLHHSHISLEFFYQISEQLCEIFSYLHSKQPTPLLYMDLKPEHIILCGMEIKLIDFNVSTYISKTGNICYLFGNENFSAPEIKHNAVPNLTWDIYSIGKLMQYLCNFIDAPLSPKIHNIIKKATHAEPTCRFETVDELSSAISHEYLSICRSHSCTTIRNIAIIGSHSGCGTTHIALSLVSTLNFMGYSTYYYEKNETNHLMQISEILSHMKEDKGLLSYQFFQGYPNYGQGVVLPTPNPSTFISVFDYGSSCNIQNIKADLILFICSNSIWHIQQTLSKKETLFAFQNNVKIICNMGQKTTHDILAKWFQSPVFLYFYDTNPFHITDEKVKFTSKLLCKKRRTHLFFHSKK